MRNDIDIVILYEKAHRELDVACALKVLAEEKSFSVEIIQQDYDYCGALERFRPRVVVLPFCYQNRSNNIYLMRWREAIFVNMSWEQFFYPGNRSAKTPRGVFPLQHVFHLSWSDAYSSQLAGIGIPEQRRLQVGNPALALYREPYRYYFAQREALAKRYGLDISRRWVFFPENYNWAFYEDSMLRQMEEDGQSQEDVAAMREFTLRSFDEAISWCKRLVADEKIELVLRPRPATTPARMAQRVEELIGSLPEGFHIIQDETVREWILASDLVVSSYSTTLIEAAVAGRPISMLEPFELPEVLIQSWHHMAPRITSYTDFRSLVQRAKKGQAYRSTDLAAWADANLLNKGDPIVAILNCLCDLRRGVLQSPPSATIESVTFGGPACLPTRLWWLWKYARSFVSQYKVSLGFSHAPSDDIVSDVAARMSISSRCRRWKDCLVETNSSIQAWMRNRRYT